MLFPLFEGLYKKPHDELVLLKELREMFPDSKYIFVSERGEVMSTDAVRKLLGRLAKDYYELLESIIV